MRPSLNHRFGLVLVRGGFISDVCGYSSVQGNVPPLQHLPDNATKLDARMRGNISVLHDGVSVPSACLPFSVIPAVYLDWYRAVFEQGRRVTPPDSVHSVIAIAAAHVAQPLAGGSFTVTEIREFDSEIVWHDGVITVTQQSIYFDGKQYSKPPFDVKLITTPRRRHLVAAYNDGTRLQFRDLTVDRNIDTHIEGEEVMLSNGQLYIKQHENIFAIDFIEVANNCLVGLRAVANVMMKSTRMFEGVAIRICSERTTRRFQLQAEDVIRYVYRIWMGRRLSMRDCIATFWLL